MRVQGIREDIAAATRLVASSFCPSRGGLLLDTPGMRTVLMWEGEEGLKTASRTSKSWRCVAASAIAVTGGEPAAAVQSALETGELMRGASRLSQSGR